jgi:hypothetical protein
LRAQVADGPIEGVDLEGDLRVRARGLSGRLPGWRWWIVSVGVAERTAEHVYDHERGDPEDDDAAAAASAR